MVTAEGLSEGSVFAERYVIVRRIGAGGMGAVYEVLHRETRRRRALKVLLPILVSDPDARARFAQEATITAEIESEHLVETFDAGIDKSTGCPFLVMELLRGESLGDYLAAGNRLSPAHVVDILRQAARAFERTHAAGIIHRDIKPDNLFLVPREDGSVRLKVLDFGISKMVQQASKSRNTVNIGTPLYMAPEQLDGGRLDHTADLFSLGHVAFELLTGESYWEHELRNSPSTLALLRWMEGPLPELPSVRAARLGVRVGPQFDAWFMRATTRNPRQRYQSATELVEAFVAALGLGVAGLSMAAPLTLGRGSLPSMSEARPETLRGVATNPRAVLADDPTDDRETAPRPPPAPASFGTLPIPAPRKPSPMPIVLTVIAAGLVLGLGGTLLFLGGSSPKVPAMRTQLSPALPALPAASGPAVTATSAVPEASASASAAPSASAPALTASAKATTKPPIRNPPGRDPRYCRMYPDRCR